MSTSERELTEPVDLCAGRVVAEPGGTGLVAPAAAPGEPRRLLRGEQAVGLLGGPRRRPGGVARCTPTSTTSAWPTCTGPIWSRARPAGTGILVPADAVDAAGAPGHRALVGRPRRPRPARSSTTTAARGCAATWTEADGRPGRLDVLVELPAGPRVAQRRHPVERRRCSTSPRSTRPDRRSGELVGGRPPVGGRRHRTGDAWGVLDVGRGRWPTEIAWNWGGGAGRSGEHVVGLQFGAKWTEGTGFTENGAHRRRPADQDRPRAALGLRLGRADASRGASSIPAVSSTWC